MSIEQLANLSVTSVSRRPENLSDAAAAIYVITAEDIRRSGYVRLADVLRLAPNLEVAQMNGQTYAISARGFNSNVDANKLLVMVDGRSIYSPIHSETFWDQLQVPLDDIAQIEVISGPGGVQWGANAVNGVINIITKKAGDTQGGLVDLKAGTVDQNGLVRYGGTFGAGGTYRVYGQGLDVGPAVRPGGASAGDGWHGGQTGFRTDWQGGNDAVMIEGDSSSITAGNMAATWSAAGTTCWTTDRAWRCKPRMTRSDATSSAAAITIMICRRNIRSVPAAT